jgi:thymidine kinase
MFSGKTEELIRRVRRAIIAHQKVQIFKPQLDDRYGVERVTSHNGMTVSAVPVKDAKDIVDCLESDTTVVAIDEVQFFTNEITDVVESLANRGIRVIAAGLDMDFRAEPFGCMPALLCLAEEITKLSAICVQCGDLATRSQRLVNGEPAHYNDPIIMVGAQERYEARCRACHKVPKDEKSETL